MTNPTLLDVTGAPIELYGLTLHPLRLAQLGELEKWAKQEVMTRTRELIGSARMRGSEQQALWAEAFRHASLLCFATPEGRSAMVASIEGMQRLVWMALRVGQPKLTFAEAQVLIPDAHLGDLVERIMVLSNFITDEQLVLAKHYRRQGDDVAPDDDDDDEEGDDDADDENPPPGSAASTSA